MKIETKRLLIRTLRIDDKKAFVEMAADGSLKEIGFSKDCGNWIANWIVEAKELTKKDNPRTEYLAYVITLKEEKTVIGSVGCSYYEDLQETGITYFIGTQYRNHGYAIEAVQAYAQYFLQNYHISQMIATVKEENVASWKVIERAGFQLTEKKMYKDLNDEKAELYRFYCKHKMKMGLAYDNHDSRIKYYELLLERDLDNLAQYELPEGYRFAFYQHGDCDAWIAIEKSAKEFENYEQGLAAWNKYYATNEQELGNRMVFIENEKGKKVATATAYYDITGRDQSGAGWLHWVAVQREYQGKRLSKPLIAHVLNIMRALGYTHAKIPTQTTTWLACKVYLDFGFRPLPQNAVNSKEGWRIVKTITNHPALDAFDPVSLKEIEDEGDENDRTEIK